MIINERDRAEKELLSAIFYAYDAVMATATHKVESTDFAVSVNRIIWNAMKVAWDNTGVLTEGIIIDTVRDSDAVADFTDVLTVHIQAITPEHTWDVLLKRLRERSKADELKVFAADISKKEKVSSTEIKRFNRMIEDANRPENLKTTKTVANEFFEMACDKFSGKMTGVPTGFDKLDTLIGGFSPQNLYILAARPKCGKTAMKQQFVRSLIKTNHAPLMVCCEMAAKMEAMRMVAADTGINATRIQTGNFSEAELGIISDSTYRMFGNPSFSILDLVGASYIEICAAVNERFREQHYDVVFIDQLQAMRFKGQSLVREIGLATKTFRNLGNKLNCAVVLLCQLSRASDRNEGGMPQLSNLRDSGDIEQDADVVMFIHHDREQDDTEEDKDCSLIVAASRYGAPGRVSMVFNGPTTTFSETQKPWRD
ncbi:MAG: AAA family ATPase [Aestuariibacter sp.]|nr:AAA family ATPase [Aestuariibacter sp.]